MKIYVEILLQVISILFFSGSTLGGAESGCPLVHGDEARNVNDVLEHSLARCFGDVVDIDLRSLLENPSASISAPFLRGYCQKQDLIKTCLSTNSSYSSVCHNETRHFDFIFLEDILKTTLSYSCIEKGEHLALLVHMVFGKNDSTTERNAVTDCIGVAESSGVEGVLGFYRELKVFKRCFMQRMRGTHRAGFGAELILNGILRSMNCPHPEDGTVTLCETIDTTPSTEEKVCPFDGIHDDEPPRFEIFIEFGAQCAIVNLNQLDIDNLINFMTIEDYRSFFNIYCENRPYILNCLSDVSSNSKVCQSRISHQVLGLFIDLIQHLLETGCKQHGETVATIFSGMLSSDEKAVGNNTVRDCMDSAVDQFKSNSNFSDTLPVKALLVYRVIISLKQCILDGSSDVGAFKTVFDAFTNEIITAQKCVNPDDGATVFCESLVTK